ncbi:hypothetical protein WN51_04707 [Melipona quadrifasciata]|uniref:Uncharacterized protein n=1 Tax=Melipona quadrifasciata TaxID=166423 RepID=A0A0N0BKN3_9HYME|nr:hypothetical protein WN51_04707 [Melipona quadrifasciata]
MSESTVLMKFQNFHTTHMTYSQKISTTMKKTEHSISGRKYVN